MQDIISVNNNNYVRKEVDNVSIYYHLKTLDLKNVPSIHEIKGNVIYYEYINGTTLYNLLENKILNQTERIIIGLQLITCLKELNDNLIIHKDLKPENIIIDNRTQLFIIDFGASRLYDDENKERDTQLFGTRGYASPEHYGYAQTTYQSDMYSLGRILIDLKLPDTFTDIINKCTEINPKDRFNSYEELLESYEKAMKGKVVITLKQKVTNIIKVIFNQEYGYNYDKSYVQRGIAVFIIIVWLEGLLGFSKPTVVEGDIVNSFANGVFAYIVIIYTIDLIRVLINSKKKSKNINKEYIKRFFINLLIVYIIVAIMAMIFNLIN